MNDDVHYPFVREALALAEAAVAKGNHPFGALLVKDGEIVLRAENTIYTGRDVTNHAEMNLVRMAVNQYGGEFLHDCVLYTSTEPCAMCTGAMYWAGIRTVVYACAETRLTEIARSGLNIGCRDVLRNASEAVTVIGPVLQDEAEILHKSYWK
jgi:tRNA(Arg) A34 adenosine deaminase TadA